MLLTRTDKLINYRLVTRSNVIQENELLSKNIREFYNEGNNSLTRKSYNSAASLFFKALAVLADWYILSKEGFIPKSHSDRFRILQEKYHNVYLMLDKDFPTYQKSYSISVSKEEVEVLKHDVETIAEETEFKLD